MEINRTRFFALAVILVQNLCFGQYVPFDHELIGGEIVLNDPATRIKDIASLLNGDDFTVTVKLSWDKIVVGNSTTLNFFNSSTWEPNVVEWSTFVDGELLVSGTESLDNSRDLPDVITVGTGSVKIFGRHEVIVEVSLDGVVVVAERSYRSFDGILTIVPVIVILFLALTTNMVELSLGIGVFVGACIITGTPIEAFERVLNKYLIGAMADESHTYVYLFTLFMSGLIGMIEKSGGLLGFTRMMSKLASTSQTGQFATFLTGFIIFFDDYANILVGGAAMRPVLDALNVSREKLAFIIDATAAPVASLIPISTWVGFEVGLIQMEVDRIIEYVGEENLTISSSGFSVLLETIGYRFYIIFMVFLIPILIISGRDFGPMLVSERWVNTYGGENGGPGAAKGSGGSEMKSGNEPDPDTPQRPWNMLLPVFALVFFIVYFLIDTGMENSGGATNLQDIILVADSYKSMLNGTMCATLSTMVLYLLQYKKEGKLVFPTPSSFLPGSCSNNSSAPKPVVSIYESVNSFLIGMERVFPTLTIITLAWACGAIMNDIGLNRYFAQLITGSEYRLLPTISFAVSFVIALATGSSWSCMTIMVPLLLFPTYVASDGDAIVFYGTTAGILSGAVAGDHVSPISDTTVLSATATQCDLLQHVKTQAPYAIVCSLLAILAGTLPVGFGIFPMWVALVAGFVLTLCFVFFVGAKPINPKGSYDLVTELYLCCYPDQNLTKLKNDSITVFETKHFVTIDGNEEKAVELPDQSGVFQYPSDTETPTNTVENAPLKSDDKDEFISHMPND